MGVGGSRPHRVAADTSDTLPVVSEKYVASGAKLETSRKFIPTPFHSTDASVSSPELTSFFKHRSQLSMSKDGDDSEERAFPTHNCGTLSSSFGGPLRAPALDLTLDTWTLRFNHDAIEEMYVKDSWETNVCMARMLW
jgi:hypothetical protein